MPSSCKDIRAALASCLASSDCVMVQRHSARECLCPPLLETLPLQCQQLKHGYGQCKRGMVDMRKRFRGNMPIGISPELQGESRGQLYAGRPAVGGQQATEGREDEVDAAEGVVGVDGIWRPKEK
ncbi:MAG: hypothetical protein Q9195_004906 [Heterodermia aff. obscurata]